MHVDQIFLCKIVPIQADGALHSFSNPTASLTKLSLWLREVPDFKSDVCISGGLLERMAECMLTTVKINEYLYPSSSIVKITLRVRRTKSACPSASRNSDEFSLNWTGITKLGEIVMITTSTLRPNVSCS